MILKLLESIRDLRNKIPVIQMTNKQLHVLSHSVVI